MRQLVGRAHHEVLEGELRVSKAVRLPLGRGGAALKLQEPGVVQDLHLEVHGEDVVKGGLDAVQKEGLQIPPFEIAGAVEIAGIALDIHHAELVEPGGNGGFGERPPELAQDILPNVGDGVQKETPLFSKHLFIIAEKAAIGNTYSNNKQRVLNDAFPSS